MPGSRVSLQNFTVYPDRTSRIAAISDVVIDDSIVIRSVRLVASKDGTIFASMPSRKVGDVWVSHIDLSDALMRAVRDAMVQALHDDGRPS